MDTRFIDLIRQDIEDKFEQVPQKFNEAMSALSLFEDGFKSLIQLGITLPLRDLPEAKKHEFPLMLYKGSDYRIVKNDEEAKDAVVDGYKAREDAHSEAFRPAVVGEGEDQTKSAPAVIVSNEPVPQPSAGTPVGEAGSTQSLMDKIKGDAEKKEAE